MDPLCDPSVESEHPPRKVSGLEIVFRLTRIQFLPLIILPVLLGTFFAYHELHTLNPMSLSIALAGSIFLHLGANAIDDCYDYQNGVDKVIDTMFPKDFGGWKPSRES